MPYRSFKSLFFLKAFLNCFVFHDRDDIYDECSTDGCLRPKSLVKDIRVHTVFSYRFFPLCIVYILLDAEKHKTRFFRALQVPELVAFEKRRNTNQARYLRLLSQMADFLEVTFLSSSSVERINDKNVSSSWFVCFCSATNIDYLK